MNSKSTDPPSLNTSITAKGTATLTLESGFSTLIITIDDELCQHVLGQITDSGWNCSRQLVTFRRELFQLDHIFERVRNLTFKFVILD